MHIGKFGRMLISIVASGFVAMLITVAVSPLIGRAALFTTMPVYCVAWLPVSLVVDVFEL